jgi:D-3-phosphoglycerate dehydrogenase / 2-oxoglutarate reductase
MANAPRFRVLVLNQISANGLKRLPADIYTTGKDTSDPDAVRVW